MDLQLPSLYPSQARILTTVFFFFLICVCLNFVSGSQFWARQISRYRISLHLSVLCSYSWSVLTSSPITRCRSYWSLFAESSTCDCSSTHIEWREGWKCRRKPPEHRQHDSCGRYNGHIDLCGVLEDGMRDWQWKFIPHMWFLRLKGQDQTFSRFVWFLLSLPSLACRWNLLVVSGSSVCVCVCVYSTLYISLLKHDR